MPVVVIGQVMRWRRDPRAKRVVAAVPLFFWYPRDEARFHHRMRWWSRRCEDGSPTAGQAFLTRVTSARCAFVVIIIDSDAAIAMPCGSM